MAVQPCGARLVCAQAAKGETMRLFLLFHGAIDLTLRALMGWLPWELELLIPSHPVEREAPSRQLTAIHPRSAQHWTEGLMPAAGSSKFPKAEAPDLRKTQDSAG